MADITLPGTSSLVPLPDRAKTAAVLHCAGHTILFDCSKGTQCAARKAGVSLMRTDLISLTHYHGDHISGLPGLLQTTAMIGRTEPVTLTGPKGLAEELAPHFDKGTVQRILHPLRVERFTPEDRGSGRTPLSRPAFSSTLPTSQGASCLKEKGTFRPRGHVT